ncbi:MAG: FAD-binding monooxygenase [Burkholderiales bacterium]|nr:MAG: FAD-binding monooxygenase [Burkholderiales bacterium]
MSADALPAEIVQAIAISNAKSIGEQPAVLANLALAQQIFNQNMQQQIALSQQQAMNQVHMATAATTASLIAQAGQGGCVSRPAIEQIAKDVARLLAELDRKPPPHG